MSKFSINSIVDVYPWLYEVHYDNECMGSYIVKSPFGNCQNFSICQFSRLLNFIEYKNEDLLESLRSIANDGIDKKLIVVDIYETCYQKIKDELKFITESKYKNKTGAIMRLCIIDINEDVN